MNEFKWFFIAIIAIAVSGNVCMWLNSKEKSQIKIKELELQIEMYRNGHK